VRDRPKVVVVGGGLAGMTVAHELGKQGIDVMILEAALRLGGKAGADLVGGRYEEHGNHFFPAWYVNTRRLLDELGLARSLVDLTRLHQLRRDRFPSFETLVSPTLFRNIPRNVAAGVLRWTDAALLVYSLVDLACRRDGEADELDEISLGEFIRSRPYGFDAVEEAAEALVLKSIAISTSRMSALTKRTIVESWLRYRNPMYSILDTNLQQAFIEPFEAQLRRLGCRIELGRRVERVVLDGRRVVGVQVGEGARVPADVVVLATPPEVTACIADADVRRAATELSGIDRLESVPMASMSLYLDRPVPELPGEHVMLAHSRYALSFIDVAQIWPGYSGAALMFNIGDPQPLHTHAPDEMVRLVIDELRRFVPAIHSEQICGYHMRPNLDAPLLMNTTGSWRHRPQPGPTRLAGLHLAGDYCRSAVNVASMEGAIASGLAVAAAILENTGLKLTRPVALRPPPRAALRIARTALFPAALSLSWWARTRRRGRPSAHEPAAEPR
jgi:uncharacterized protein with NAD-binding domain and iron-sulfur cluster